MYGFVVVFFFKHKTAYEMRISDWSSDVCSSDLQAFAIMMPDWLPSLVSFSVYWLVSATSIELTVAKAANSGMKRTTAAIKTVGKAKARVYQIGKASCRERVCQYV